MKAEKVDNLIRKQIMLSKENITKLQIISKTEKSSFADVVRKSIDAYDPNPANEDDIEEMLSVMSTSIKDAAKSVDQASKHVRATNKKYRKLHPQELDS